MAIKTINRVLSVIDTKKNLENLLDFVLIKMKFVSYAEKKYLPETIKSYFRSLGHSYSFFLSEKPDEIPVNSELVTQAEERETMVIFLQKIKPIKEMGKAGGGRPVYPFA